jgi:hypothetical protein
VAHSEEGTAVADERQDVAGEPFVGFRFRQPEFTDAPVPRVAAVAPAVTVPQGIDAGSGDQYGGDRASIAPSTETPLATTFELGATFETTPAFVLPPSHPSVASPPEAASRDGAMPAPSLADMTAQPLGASFALERRPQRRQRAIGALDWIAFGLAFLVPPIGVLTAVAALVVGSRARGWTTGIAKAAAGIGVALSLVLGGGAVVAVRNANATAAHDAVVSSSAKWCGSIRSDPGRLRSSTWGWPPVGGTIASSIPAMQRYADYWTALAKIAPPGITVETQKIADAASAIVASVTTSRVLDDAGNVARMQQIVSASTIPSWVAEYCN